MEKCRELLGSGGLCQRNVNHGGFHTLKPDRRTLKELAREAWDVQDACNLSGIVNSFNRALSDLRDLPECTGNDWLHSHPITRAWVDKIASLCALQGSHGSSRAMEAITAVRKMKDA